MKNNKAIEHILEGKEAETKKIIRNIVKQIVDEEGELDENYIGNLRLLAENYDLCFRLRAQLDESNYLIICAKGGKPMANPLFSIINKCERTIISIMRDFGLDITNKNRIRKLKKENGHSEEGDASPLDEFFS